MTSSQNVGQRRFGSTPSSSTRSRPPPGSDPGRERERRPLDRRGPRRRRARRSGRAAWKSRYSSVSSVANTRAPTVRASQRTRVAGRVGRVVPARERGDERRPPQRGLRVPPDRHAFTLRVPCWPGLRRLRADDGIAQACRARRSRSRRRRRRRSQRGGVRAAPTPDGVPVRITSPGSSVQALADPRDQRRHVENTSSDVFDDCITSPLTRVSIGRPAREVDLVEADDLGTERAERVERLRPRPLPGRELVIARRHVVRDRDARDVLERVARRARRVARVPITTASSPS